MNRFFALGLALALLLSAPTGCYTTAAMRRSERIVRGGIDFDALGPWVLVAGPASVLVAGAAFAFGSVVPIHDGVDPREPPAKWFAGYTGPLLQAEDVGFLCHRDPATWVTGIRESGTGPWNAAREEKWHFPVCIEVLPGRYELEVHYFARQHDDDRELSVSHQAESTEPSIIVWESVAPGRWIRWRPRSRARGHRRIYRRSGTFRARAPSAPPGGNSRRASGTRASIAKAPGRRPSR